ncbi:hypothetical protein MMC15_005948 [Xylographa vitiligo]|nr:hypothetical protein [Xylographa vitiligo]
MVLPEGGFRTRAASLLHSASPFRSSSISSEAAHGHPLNQSTDPLERPSLAEKSQLDGTIQVDRSVSTSSNEKTLASPGGDVAAENTAAQRRVRPSPIWAKAIDEEDELLDASSQLLPKQPPDAQVAQHNSSPSSKQKKQGPGHLYDADRESTPPTTRHHISEIGSRWRAFADETAYPVTSAEGGQRVDEEWLIQNGPDYSQPWQLAAESDLEKPGGRSAKIRQQAWYKRLQRTGLRNPIVPLVLRMIVWSFSFAALILGILIYQTYQTNHTSSHSASPIMAIIIDAIALVYIVYITRDEYTGKPLGLRSPKAKMRLIFLDIFFIVFDSANLSLAFEAITDAKTTAPFCPLGQLVCRQQEALASVLLIALVAWMMTFSISVLRVVERIGVGV